MTRVSATGSLVSWCQAAEPGRRVRRPDLGGEAEHAHQGEQDERAAAQVVHVGGQARDDEEHREQ